MAILSKATFKDLQGLKTRFNGHNEDYDTMNINFQHLKIITNQTFTELMRHLTVTIW